MPTVLQINASVIFGSTGRISEEIGLFAINKGWNSFIAYGRNGRPSKSYTIRIGSDWNVRLHGLQTRLFDNHGFASKEATYKFISQIAEIKPDIIHLHNIHGYYLNIEFLFNYLAKVDIPIVWTLHDCWSFTGHCSYFSYVGCNKWKVHCEKCPQKQEYPTSYFKDNSYINFEKKRKIFTSVKNMTIVPVSNWLSNIVRESFLNEFTIKVIHNGIDLSVFKPINQNEIRNPFNLNNKFIILGVACDWRKGKGLKDFLELNKHLGNGEVIILIGLPKKIIKTLPKGIIGIEHTENAEMLAKFYSAADIFINPTWDDNFPTTNLESLACGTPVITYNTGGSIEAVSEETGFIVEQGDIDGILHCISIVKQKGKKLYIKSCRMRALDLYNKDLCYENYYNLYTELINK